MYHKKGRQVKRDVLVPYFDLSNEVTMRLQYLKEVEKEVKQEYDELPQGKLLVAPGRTTNCFRYYYREQPSDVQGRYLNKNEQKMKNDLATKKYYEGLLKNVKKEIKALEKFINSYEGDSIIDTYTNLHAGVKRLIKPVNIDDDTFEKQWLSISYEGNRFDDEDKTSFYSDRNERMRSKSEVLIANELIKNNIPYKYECPVHIMTRRGRQTIYPDFTVLIAKKRKVIYWEHLGKMGDIDYITRNLKKLEDYKENGINIGDNLVITYESATVPLNTKDISRVIQTMFDM